MMNVEIPKVALAFGSYGIPQGDVIECRVHLGCTKEVSSFEVLLQNWDKKYSPGGAYPLSVGMDGSIFIGRGANVPQIITCRIESVKYESSPTENYVRLGGRCWGERLFRRVVTKTYENKKGEEIVKDLIDYYVGLSHNRDGTELIENTDTTYTKLEYDNTPVFDILKYIAESADKNGVIGFDFRITPDAKFEFFPRNSKTSPIRLNEKIEESEYRKDIHGVRNKVTIYGAPDKSVPLDKDSYSDGIADYLLSDDSEDTYNQPVYYFVGGFIYNPEPHEKIHLRIVELEAKVDSGTGYYKITYQLEGGEETIIVADQAVTNTDYQLKQHTCDIWGEIGKDVIIRFYTRVEGGIIYSRKYRARGDVFKGNWNPVAGEISIDLNNRVRGNTSIKCSAYQNYYASCYLKFPSPVNCELYPFLNMWLKRESSFSGNVNVILYDDENNPSSNWFTIGAEEWFQKQFKVGSKNADQWEIYETFHWDKVATVRIDCWFSGVGSGSFWVDGLYFGGRRYSSIQEDSESQSAYGLRELVDVDEELYSDNECTLRAKALLNHLKNPAEYLTIRSTVIDYGNTPLLPGDKIHVTLPNENVDADFRILSVDYYVDAKMQTLEITLELGRETPLLADYLHALRSKTDHLSRHKAAR
jgi:hypothetical protein